MKHLSTFFLLFACCSLYSQDYIAYQRTFNRIDHDMINRDFDAALRRLDSIDRRYDFVYAQHCIKALQVCVAANNSPGAAKWLARCFRQGVPLWLIKANRITKKALRYTETQHVMQQYDSLNELYRSSVNTKVSALIDSLLDIDQKYTNKVNNGFLPLRYTLYYWQWKRNNKRQFAIIDRIIDQYGFPGERLIGLSRTIEDSIKAGSDIAFYGPYLFDRRAGTMLLHYYSSPRKDINGKLWKSVVNGYLPPGQYASFNDFRARWGRGKYGQAEYYNVWHFDPDTANLPAIEKRRLQIGLDTFEQQQRNILINRERRKSKAADAGILLE